MFDLCLEVMVGCFIKKNSAPLFLTFPFCQLKCMRDEVGTKQASTMTTVATLVYEHTFTFHPM